MAQFALSWDAHKNNICTGLSALQQNGEFVDMTLAADGHHVKVHQMVLSLSSPYMKEIITSTQCTHPVIFLNKISYATLCAILEYIYTGEVLIAQENLNELIAAGKELHIKGLQDMQVEISATSEASSSQIAGYNQGHQLTTSAHHREPDQTLISRAKMKTPPQNTCKKVEEQDIETRCLSDNADDDIHETMDTENEHATNNVTSLADGRKDTRVQYTMSNQGSLQMILNRYVYCIGYTSQRDRSVKRWRCVDNRRRRCPAAVITKDEVVVKRQAAHNHPFHDQKILKKVRNNAIFSAICDAQQNIEVMGAKKKSGAANSTNDSIDE